MFQNAAGISPSNAIEAFGKVNLVGKAFGILKFVPEGETEEVDI